jgi:hypothetical protein
MSFTNENPSAGRSGSGDGSGGFEDTLRLIAHLPAPEGLAERVQAGLHASALSAPQSGRILAWPGALRPGSEWMRSAAAAAIVFVVVGGGWGVYSRVQPQQPARVITMPPRVVAPGGFSGANAMRTPNTLKGPLLAHPVMARPAQAKTPARATQKPNRRAAHSSAVGTGAGQPTAAAAK